jgi:hypothetical protein
VVATLAQYTQEGAKMTALAQAFSRASGTEISTEALKVVAVFSGTGLLVSLLFASYGLDLSAGFF